MFLKLKINFFEHIFYYNLLHFVKRDGRTGKEERRRERENVQAYTPKVTARLKY